MQENPNPDWSVNIDAVAEIVASRRGALAAEKDFPADIWTALAARGLLGLGLPVSHGGQGGGYREMAGAAHRLTARGGVMGVTISWLCHLMNARLHLARKGDKAQRDHWLPRLAAGDSTICLAISEPDVGAHPKHLATRAVCDGTNFVLNGAKTYLTNGPLADLFIVLAVTGEADGRKTFSAILVPSDAPGLEETPGVAIDFLHPSPHCGIKLIDCRVPAENLLGEADTGLAEISLPMRAIEDALNAATLSGAMDAQLKDIAGLLPTTEDDAMRRFGGLLAKADALRALATKLADDLDADDQAPERLNGTSAGVRGFLRTLQDELDAFAAAQGVVLSDEAATLRRDLEKSLGIAGWAHGIQAAKRARAYVAGLGDEGKDT